MAHTGGENQDESVAHRPVINASPGVLQGASDTLLRVQVCLLPYHGDLGRPMGLSTLNKMFARMGYGNVTVHGLRATASTLLNEQGFKPDVIERQLTHVERNRIRAAYNRAEYLDERRQMLQHWANYLDAVASGAVVTALRSRAA